MFFKATLFSLVCFFSLIVMYLSSFPSTFLLRVHFKLNYTFLTLFKSYENFRSRILKLICYMCGKKLMKNMIVSKCYFLNFLVIKHQY